MLTGVYAKESENVRHVHILSNYRVYTCTCLLHFLTMWFTKYSTGQKWYDLYQNCSL